MTYKDEEEGIPVWVVCLFNTCAVPCYPVAPADADETFCLRNDRKTNPIQNEVYVFESGGSRKEKKKGMKKGQASE